MKAETILSEFAEYLGQQWDATVVDAFFALVESGTINLADANDTTRVYDGLGTIVPSS